jgi:hypothetical protein
MGDIPYQLPHRLIEAVIDPVVLDRDHSGNRIPATGERNCNRSVPDPQPEQLDVQALCHERRALMYRGASRARLHHCFCATQPNDRYLLEVAVSKEIVGSLL